MGARTLTRWQKASALVPMVVLVGAWGAALSNSTLASATGGISDSDIPEVPATAIDQPASVQATPAGLDEKAGATGTISTLATNGIPSSALSAYRRAETLLAKADQECNLPWNLVAAIGRVESNHGRSNGNSLNSDGLATPGIYGLPLDGKDGRARIVDTDNGKLDKDSELDRAVGPMQFIPATWNTVGVDSDNDGVKNPQDIDDAATSAGIYLCAGSGNLSNIKDATAAIKRYNNSDSYADLVLRISAAYAKGDFSQSPNGYTTAPILTSSSYDQTLTPKQRQAAKKAQDKAEAKPKPTDGGGSTGGSTGGGSTGGSTGGGSTGGGTSGSTGGSTLGSGVQNLVKDTPLAPITEPVTGLLTTVEATLQCTLRFPFGPNAARQQCIYDLTH